MSSLAIDPVPWMLAALAFVAVGALIAALLAIMRLEPLIGQAREDPAGPGDPRR